MKQNFLDPDGPNDRQARELAEERTRLKFISESSQALISSCDYTKILRAIAKLAVPTIADWCAIDLIEEGELVPHFFVVENADPRKLIRGRELLKQYPTDWNSQCSLAKVFKTGVAHLYSDISQEFLTSQAKDANHLKLLQELGMISLMIVPIKFAGRIFGVMRFVSSQAHRKFRDADLALAEDLAARAALAIENSRLCRTAEKEKAARQRMSRRLIDTDEQFQKMADSIPQLAWLAHPNGNIFWYNKRWYDYTGAQPMAQFGWGWKSAQHPEYLEKVVEQWTDCIISGQAFEMEFPLRARDGSYRWFLTLATPIRDTNLKITRWFGTNTDIQEQKNTQGKLEKAIEVRDEFLSIASHELRTPLTSLYLHLQMLERSAVKSNDSLQNVGARLRTTTRQAEHLGEIIDGLLEVSKFGSGSIDIQREEASLEQIIQDLVGRFSIQAARAGSRLSFESDAPIFGLWDTLKLSQAIGHLISNAIKYGLGKPIEVKLNEVGESACVSITDHGIGIASENQNRIFERFERAIDRQNISGMGIGLYISREIVAAHGGKIYLRSELGKGSIFTLELPIEIVAERGKAPFMKKLKQIGHSDGAVRH